MFTLTCISDHMFCMCALLSWNRENVNNEMRLLTQKYWFSVVRAYAQVCSYAHAFILVV